MRWTLMGAVLDALKVSPGLRGVDVHAGWPGDRNVTPLMVWIGFDINGNPNIPVATAGRKQYDDEFSFPLEMRVAGTANLYDAAEKVDAVMADVLRVLATDPTLGNLPSLVTATVSEMRGPYAENTPDGPMGWAEVTITAHLRIT